MARDIALAIGLLALLALALFAVPTQTLLRNSLRLRIAIGVLSGLAAGANMALPALRDLLAPIDTAPVGSAVAMLAFGPVAGLASGAIALLSHALLHPSSWGLGSAILVGSVGLAYSWHWVRARAGVIAALLGLAITLPLVLQACLQLLGKASAAPWLEQVPWRFGLGVLVLGAGIELIVCRARTLQALQDAHTALQRRDNELELALEAAHGGRWEWDVTRQTLQCSGNFYDDFGLPGDGRVAPSQRWNALRHPDDAERVLREMQHTLAAKNERFHIEYRLRNAAGQWRWLLSRGIVAERGADGSTLRMVGLHLDVSAYREVENSLRTAQAKYTAIYQTMADPAGITRIADGRYLEVNPAFCEMLGRTREQVVGYTAQEIGIWATPEERPKLLQALQRDGKAERLALVAQRDGVRIPGLMSARPVTLNGEACLVFVFHDTTLETRAHDELMAGNKILQQAGRLARLGAWEEARDQGLVYWSDVCYDIHGLPHGAPLPRHYIDQYVAPAWQEPMRRQIRQAILQRTEWGMEVEIVRADGSLCWVRMRGEPVLENGRVTRLRGVMLDIDEAKRAEHLLRQSQERFTRIFQLLPYPMGLTRRGDGRYVDVNAAWEQALGFSRDEAVGQSAISLGIYTPQQRAAVVEAFQTQGQLHSCEAQMTVRSGEQRTVLQSMRPIEFDGEACWLFALHDITERKRSEERVREREELLSLTISAASLGLWDWNLQSGMVSGDARWRALRGTEATDTDTDGATDEAVSWTTAVGPAHMQAIAAELARHTAQPETPFDATWCVVRPGEEDRWVRNLGKVISRDSAGQPLRMVGVGIDVTTQRAQEQRLQQLAHYDALTGLPNRVLLAQQLEEAMAQARSSQRLLGVAYLDLDGFKPVNDRFGHAAGDRLLVVAASRLSRALRTRDCVARLGGDEFVILLSDLADVSDCERALRLVMESLSAPYTLGTERVTVTASIGYTLYPQDGADADTLLRHADQAMYAAKQAGRNRFHRFDAEHERATQQVHQQLAHLRAALADGQFVLYLQPKVDMQSGTVVGAEALARWHHPERGVLSPAAFLPLLENSEQETSFGAWVVDATLTILTRLQQRGLNLPVSINITAPHLQQPDFADWLVAQLARYPQVPAALLEIEITETAALYQLEPVAATLRALRAQGIHTSLDDFGTGYSSLTYLRRLPLSMLKIDQSFVHGMMTDPGDLAIVQGVVGLARSFGYRVIAEGVETIDQGQMLLQMGCPLAQGYCVARPMPVDAFMDWVPHWQAPAEWQRRVAGHIN